MENYVVNVAIESRRKIKPTLFMSPKEFKILQLGMDALSPQEGQVFYVKHWSWVPAADHSLPFLLLPLQLASVSPSPIPCWCVSLFLVLLVMSAQLCSFSDLSCPPSAFLMPVHISVCAPTQPLSSWSLNLFYTIENNLFTAQFPQLCLLSVMFVHLLAKTEYCVFHISLLASF